MKNGVNRDAYLKYRNEEDKDEILRTYFNLSTNYHYDLDYGNFMVVYMQVMDEYPGLEEDITRLWPTILTYLDKYFNLTFVVHTKKIKEITEKQELLIII